jgi:hypothetical protein
MFQCADHQLISLADLRCSVNHVKTLILCLQNIAVRKYDDSKYDCTCSKYSGSIENVAVVSKYGGTCSKNGGSQ